MHEEEEIVVEQGHEYAVQQKWLVHQPQQVGVLLRPAVQQFLLPVFLHRA